MNFLWMKGSIFMFCWQTLKLSWLAFLVALSLHSYITWRALASLMSGFLSFFLLFVSLLVVPALCQGLGHTMTPPLTRLPLPQALLLLLLPQSLPLLLPPLVRGSGPHRYPHPPALPPSSWTLRLSALKLRHCGLRLRPPTLTLRPTALMPRLSAWLLLLLLLRLPSPAAMCMLCVVIPPTPWAPRRARLCSGTRRRATRLARCVCIMPMRMCPAQERFEVGLSAFCCCWWWWWWHRAWTILIGVGRVSFLH